MLVKIFPLSGRIYLRACREQLIYQPRYVAVQGCSLPNQPYGKKDASAIARLKVARYMFPDIRRYSIGKGVAIFVGTAKDQSNYILEFKADSLEIIDSKCLIFKTIVTMRDKEDNVIWQKGYKNSSEQFNHNLDYDQLKKDNCKLLKDEIVFAVNAKVANFIEHFKNPQSGSPK